MPNGLGGTLAVSAIFSTSALAFLLARAAGPAEAVVF
jgi:uncharacterized membrane protein YdjX (TVP38/TMEM64 family)